MDGEAVGAHETEVANLISAPATEPAAEKAPTQALGGDEAQGVLKGEAETTVTLARREWRLLLSLSIVGFLVNCQPSEPYLAKYLLEGKNLSTAEVEADVWPYYTYAYFAWLLPVGLGADAVGYRPVILFGLLSRQATRVLLLYAEGLWPMSLMQVSYASATAVDTVYFAYAFLAAPEPAAPLAVSVMYAMHSLGNVCGSLLGQWLVASGHPVRLLFYYSWAFSSAGLACFVAFFPLPQGGGLPESLWSIVRREGVRGAAACVSEMYSMRIVRVWGLWWVFAYAAYSVVTNYYENEFYDIDPEGAFGLSESAMEAARMAGCLIPAVAPVAFRRQTFPLIIATSLLTAALLFMSTRARSLSFAVACNALVLGLFGFTQALSEICISRGLRGLHNARYSVVFACNTFVAAAVA